MDARRQSLTNYSGNQGNSEIKIFLRWRCNISRRDFPIKYEKYDYTTVIRLFIYIYILLSGIVIIKCIRKIIGIFVSGIFLIMSGEKILGCCIYGAFTIILINFVSLSDSSLIIYIFNYRIILKQAASIDETELFNLIGCVD